LCVTAVGVAWALAGNRKKKQITIPAQIRITNRIRICANKITILRCFLQTDRKVGDLIQKTRDLLKK
jgi:hypothetical protein